MTEQNNRAAVKLLCPSLTSVHHWSVISRSTFIDHTFYISAHGHDFLWCSRARSRALPGLTWAARCDGCKSCFVSDSHFVSLCCWWLLWLNSVCDARHQLVIRLRRIIKTVILFYSYSIFLYLWENKHQKHLGCRDDAFRALRAEIISQFID